jgi:hypothetical protein
MEFILTGLDIEEKAKIIEHSLFNSVGGKEQFDEVSVILDRTDKQNPNSNEEAMAALRISVKSKDSDLVGRMFTAKMIELALANYPGFFTSGGIRPGGPVLVYWPALVDSKQIKETVHIDGKKIDMLPSNQMDLEEIYYQKQRVEIPSPPSGKKINRPLGDLFGARSGDKGGCANVGVWAKTEKAFSFLNDYLTVKKIKELLPDLQEFEIDRYELPNILSLNFYVHGILEDGVSSNTRKDGQAKSLGEYLRAKYADIPKSLFEEKI